MRENPTDWYYRSRNELLKSIFDGIDYLNAIGDFNFAKMNLAYHQEIIERTSIDEVCDSLLKAEQKGTPSFERGAEMKLGKHHWQGRTKEREL